MNGVNFEMMNINRTILEVKDRKDVWVIQNTGLRNVCLNMVEVRIK